MGELPIMLIRGNAEAERPAFATVKRQPAAVGACLLLLLAFSTATAFVQDLWAPLSFQIGLFSLVAICVLLGIRAHAEQFADGVASWMVYAIPMWGVLQILAHTTASMVQTREATLRWGALAGVFYLTQVATRTSPARRIALTFFVGFAAAMAALCLAQLFTSEGRVLWIFPTGPENAKVADVYATFTSYNHYVQLAELALPIALWRTLREGWQSWWCVLAGGILLGSVIASASHVGAVLCIAELAVFLGLAFLGLTAKVSGEHRGTRDKLLANVPLLAVPLLAAIFLMSVGWERVLERYETNSKQVVSTELIEAALDMAWHRPLTGFGLDTFMQVQHRYALLDLPDYATHANSDWAEFAADGGVPFLLLILVPFAAAVPATLRHPWALGLVAVMLHACVGWPFPCVAVSGWMFGLLGILFIADKAAQDVAPMILPPVRRTEPAGVPD
jgi:hypothetical protein